MDWTIFIKKEFVILIPFMLAVAEFLKKTKLKTVFIAFIIWGVSIVTCTSYICLINNDNIYMNIFMGVIQGTFIGLVTLTGNKIIAQFTIKKDDNLDKAD